MSLNEDTILDRSLVYVKSPGRIGTDGVRILQNSPPVGHPGPLESWAPVWGPGRSAIANIQERDYAEAALYGALAASDLFLAGTIAKGFARGGIHVATGRGAKRLRPYDWKRVMRKHWGKKGLLRPGQDGHHWLIPQSGWGKRVPDIIKNQQWNIMPMPDRTVHGRLRHAVKNQPRFSPIERYLQGTPTWSKAVPASAVGHTATAQHGRKDRPR